MRLLALLLPSFLLLAAVAEQPRVASATEPEAPDFVAGSLPAHRAQDPRARPVTAENVMESERFWPYHVKLKEAWQPPGLERPLRKGKIGVLIRVVDRGRARIDFASYGQYDLPIEQTNLLEEANLIRTGERFKMGPNFTLALGSRLLRSDSERLVPYQYGEALEYTSFLCVFADPGSEGFAELATALAPLREHARLVTILLPQGNHTDPGVRDRLVAVDWKVPFVYAHLAAPYTRSLVGERPALPIVTLQTNEGRLLFEGQWSAEDSAKLVSAVEEAVGAKALAAGAAPEPATTP